MDQILNSFKQSSFFSRIFDGINDEIICIYISGSRIASLATENSDYDIHVITKHSKLLLVNECVKYKNSKKIHWYYNSFEKIINLEFEDWQDIFGNMLIFFLNEAHFLYKNEKYLKEINFLIDNKILIGKILSIKLCNEMKYVIQPAINDQGIIPDNYTKQYYRIGVACNIVYNNILTNTILKEIKLIKYKEVDKNIINIFYNTMIQYYNYCNSDGLKKLEELITVFSEEVKKLYA